MGKETLITLAAIVLFGLLIYNTLNNVLISTDRTIDANYILTGTSLGQSIIKEISSKSFDENCISATPEDSIEFSLPLKAEYGETYSDYDDIDDYNGFTKIVSTENTGNYEIKTSIDYVRSNNPSQISVSNTRTKRISVKDYSEMIIDTLKLYYYSSY